MGLGRWRGGGGGGGSEQWGLAGSVKVGREVRSGPVQRSHSGIPGAPQRQRVDPSAPK